MIFERKQIQRFYRYCFSLTGEPDSAADLLQTAITKWISLGQPGNQPISYIRRVIRNQFIDDKRKENSLAFETLESDSPLLIDENSLEDLRVNQEIVEFIFSKLNSAEREVVYFWAVEGYTAKEISEELNLARGTVLSRLHRVKQKVIALVSENEEASSKAQL